MSSRLADDALKLFRLDETVFVLIEMHKGLSDALSLQSTKHLRELGIGHDVPLVLGANVQRRPVSLPVEGETVFALVCLPCLVELVKVNVAGAVAVEEAEDDFVFRVWFGEQVLENGPVLERDLALLVAVGDVEQDAVLVSLDLVLEIACGQLQWGRHGEGIFT